MDFKREFHKLDIRNDIEFELDIALDWFMDTIKPINILLRLGMGKWGYMNYKRLVKAHGNIVYRYSIVKKAIDNNVSVFCGLCVKHALLELLVDSDLVYLDGEVVHCPCCNDRYSGDAPFYKFKS